jgi:lactoylglutathione lyase
MEFGFTIIFVEDVAATVTFYQVAFGIEPAIVTPMFAALKTGPTTLAFGANSNERAELGDKVTYQNNTIANDAAAVQVSFVSADVQSDFDRAVAAGATPIIEPNTKPWGQTVSRVRDCNGVLIGIVSALAAP